MAVAALEPRSEPELIAAARRGDASALAELYERHAPAVMAAAFRLLMSRADAEDVLHDVFVGLPEALRRYEERGTFGAWLKQVAVRVALMRLRDERTRSTLIDGEPVVRREPDIHGALSLRDAIAKLAPSLRAVLVLKEIEGFSHADIARLLGISRGASKVRLHRALAELRRVLQGDER